MRVRTSAPSVSHWRMLLSLRPIAVRMRTPSAWS